MDSLTSKLLSCLRGSERKLVFLGIHATYLACESLMGHHLRGDLIVCLFLTTKD